MTFYHAGFDIMLKNQLNQKFKPMIKTYNVCYIF